MRTGVYIPLFWCDRFPQYEEWAHELFGHIRGVADVLLVVHDGTLTKALPSHVAGARVPSDSTPLLRACFEKAIDVFDKAGVGGFYYIGGDDIHPADEVEALLGHIKMGADVVFSTFDHLWWDRYEEAVFPPKVDPRLHFSYEGHSWPDSACYRTDLFAGRPIHPHPQDFIIKTLKQLRDDTGREVTAVFDPTVGFFYFQHDNNKLDRTFIVDTSASKQEKSDGS